MKRFTIVSVGLLTATAFAQDKVIVQVTDSKSPVRYTIDSRSSSTRENEVLVDGEPMEGRGGFGGNGTTKQEQKVVFDEGREGGGTWRVYREANAKVERPDQDGEMQTSEIAGGMIGDRLFIVEDDRGVVIHQGDADGDQLPRFAAMGIPARTSFSGILPTTPVAVGEEFELPAGFLAALNGLTHPVRPAMDPNAAGGRGQGARGQGGRGQGGDAAGGDPAAGGQQGGRGQGGDPAAGGQQGGRGQGGRGQGGQGGARGAGGFGGGFGGANADPSLTLLANDKLEGKLLGKLEAVEDGVAKIKIHGVREAEGTIAELGMSMFGGRGGRGGRGGQGGGQAPAMEGDASASVSFEGAVWVDTRTHALVKFVLEGKSKSSSHATMDRGDREMEMNNSSEGTFRVAVSATEAPATTEDAKKEGAKKD